MAFPAELMILMRQCPNSSKIKRSASADGWWVCSAFLACSSRHSHVASSTSFVTNVYGNLKRDGDSHSQLWEERRILYCSVPTEWPQRCYSLIFVLLWRKVFLYLPAPLVITGVVLVSRSEICDDSLVLAAVCCCTLTSAASAKCINVFLSGLSSKFLQPMHLQMDEHMIFAFARGKNTCKQM